MSSIPIEFVGNASVLLDRPTLAWFDAKRFQVAPGSSDAQVLDALIRHPYYRDTYVTPNAHLDDEPVHGPYLHEHISVASYRPLSVARAERMVRAYAARHGLPRERAFTFEQRILGPIRSATSAYRLPVLGDEARYAFGWILEDFHEVVAIDARSGDVTLLVMAID